MGGDQCTGTLFDFYFHIFGLVTSAGSGGRHPVSRSSDRVPHSMLSRSDRTPDKLPEQDASHMLSVFERLAECPKTLEKICAGLARMTVCHLLRHLLSDT